MLLHGWCCMLSGPWGIAPITHPTTYMTRRRRRRHRPQSKDAAWPATRNLATQPRYTLPEPAQPDTHDKAQVRLAAPAERRGGLFRRGDIGTLVWPMWAHVGRWHDSDGVTRMA